MPRLSGPQRPRPESSAAPRDVHVEASPLPRDAADRPKAPGLGPLAGFADPRRAAREDLATLHEIAEGRLNPQEGLRRIAHNGGFPILADGKTTFVALDEAPLAVAGDHSGWRPTPLERRGPVQVLQVQGELRGGYKLVTEHGQWRADPWARAYAHEPKGELSLIRPDGPHLERFPLVGGHGLPPRTLRVWVPAEPATHHLYAQDGQNLFDPNAMFGGWHMNEAAGPRTLIVGIDNTGFGRFEEYTHTTDIIDGTERGGRADAYADFVVQTVRGLVERTYGAPRKVGILGSSLGGLVAFAAAHRHPNAFDFVGAMSPTFGWGKRGEGADNPTMIDIYRDAPRRRRPKFYVDSGGRPGGADNYDVTRKMADTLAESGYRWNKDLWHWHELDAPHNERAWADRIHRPLALFEAM